jgi:hypothetical protein
MYLIGESRSGPESRMRSGSAPVADRASMSSQCRGDRQLALRTPVRTSQRAFVRNDAEPRRPITTALFLVARNALLSPRYVSHRRTAADFRVPGGTAPVVDQRRT